MTEPNYGYWHTPWDFEREFMELGKVPYLHQRVIIDLQLDGAAQEVEIHPTSVRSARLDGGGEIMEFTVNATTQVPGQYPNVRVGRIWIKIPPGAHAVPEVVKVIPV
ncbi:hypothetical protein ABII15_13880 [Streptomyces sp. HUAS MG91]|uniref:Uncharacterized protein n=1 Tax=Streptomyces tabacisoli TaxID=3156398 RepID=A0AAU8IS17_9ACTN